jgi:F0F1-type ATP synthase membrane subunit b/b'
MSSEGPASNRDLRFLEAAVASETQRSRNWRYAFWATSILWLLCVIVGAWALSTAVARFNETEKKVSDTAKTANETAGTANEAAKRVDEIAKPANETAKRVDEIAKTANETAKRVDEIAKTLNDNARKASETAKRVDEIAKRVGELSAIGPVVYYIWPEKFTDYLHRGDFKIVTFPEKRYDPYRAVATDPTWKFKAPKAGSYLVSTFVGCQAPLHELGADRRSGYLTIGICVDRAPEFDQADVYLARQQLSSEATSIGGTATLELKEGQVLDIRVGLEGEPLATLAGLGRGWIRINYVGPPRPRLE